MTAAPEPMAEIEDRKHVDQLIEAVNIMLATPGFIRGREKASELINAILTARTARSATLTASTASAVEREKAALLDYLLSEKSDYETPILRDLCYTIFMHAKTATNKDDGGSVDWFTDTLPLVEKAIAMYRARKPAIGAKE